MTDKEIIKALEYCTTDGYCMTCPYNNCTDKQNKLVHCEGCHEKCKFDKFK